MKVFVVSALALTDMASVLRPVVAEVLGATFLTQDEEREGLNIGGGVYWAFAPDAVGDIGLYLVSNRGEVVVEEYAEFEYYISVALHEDTHAKDAAERIADALGRQGFRTAVADVV